MPIPDGVSEHALPAVAAAQLAAVTVDPVIWARWPDYRVLVIVASGLAGAAVPAATLDAAAADGSPLARAEAAIRARGEIDWTSEPHLAAWMAAFARFGAKPKRTGPSALALLKRVEAGLPRIDPVTDAYNAISITHQLPIGGEDLATYVGAPRLTIATGDEPFDTIAQGEPANEPPLPGEVIWRDDAGVTCRRWNWRQCVRTRITPATDTALFLLDALDPLTDADLLAAGDALIASLIALAPGVCTGRRLLRA